MSSSLHGCKTFRKCILYLVLLFFVNVIFKKFILFFFCFFLLFTKTSIIFFVIDMSLLNAYRFLMLHTNVLLKNT